MRLYFPVDLTGNLIMIEKLVLSEIWTGDLPIFNPDALMSAPSWQAKECDKMQTKYKTYDWISSLQRQQFRAWKKLGKWVIIQFFRDNFFRFGKKQQVVKSAV